MYKKLKKKIRFKVSRRCIWVGEIKIRRLLPNAFTQAIGPFVLLEHTFSGSQLPGSSHTEIIGKYAKPHRGIATLTYILSGEVEHFDSIGNNVKMSSGGAHWMMAGCGIVRDEMVNCGCHLTNPDVSIVRFWINLPSVRKAEQPGYLPLSATEIPEKELDDDAGWIKVLSGEYGTTIAKIPCYSREFLYHIHLKAGKIFSTATEMRFEYAAFLPANKAIINGRVFHAGELIAFASLGEIIEINNMGKTAIDIILFGGEPYRERIVAEESFVMNTPHEITQAYNDYYNNKYGLIKLKQKH
jgi:redox-sensitive bicupin YhaK (pirin superfamily)